jgi:hypothetical protein
MLTAEVRERQISLSVTRLDSIIWQWLKSIQFCVKFLTITNHCTKGRAMAQAVRRRPPTAEARVRSRLSPCGICGGQSGTGTGFSPSDSVFITHFIIHFITGAPLLGKGQKILIIFVFIIGSHNKPYGCSASVASAAGTFTTKNTTAQQFFLLLRVLANHRSNLQGVTSHRRVQRTVSMNMYQFSQKH